MRHKFSSSWRPGGPALLLAGLLLLGPLAIAPAVAAVPSVSRETLLQLRAEGAFEQALEVADALLAEAPDDADLLLIRGQVLAFLGDDAGALETLAKAARLAPDYLDIRLMQARVHGYAERHDAALAVLRPAVTAEVARLDAQLLLGRTALAAAEPEVAREAFARAALLEPAAGDAWIGLGDVARSEGVITVAQLDYERALAVPETEPVARERLESLALEQRRFELSIDSSFSRFNDDSDDWREGGIGLAWRVDDRRQLTGGLAVANRYGSTDIQASVLWNARLGERSGYFLGAAFAPAADFLPSWKLRGGIDRELLDLSGRVGQLGVGVGFVEASLADYEDGLVQGFDLGLVQYGWEGRLWLTAKAGGTFGTNGSFDPGFGLRLDWQLTKASRLFAGFGQTYDNSTQSMGTTESYFGGLDHWFNDRLGMVLSLALEDRDSGVRQTTVGLGFRVRF